MRDLETQQGGGREREKGRYLNRLRLSDHGGSGLRGGRRRSGDLDATNISLDKYKRCEPIGKKMKE